MSSPSSFFSTCNILAFVKYATLLSTLQWYLVAGGKVHEIEIQVFQLEPVQGLQEIFPHVLRLVVVVPKLKIL